MTNRIAASIRSACPVVGLLALAGACNPTGGNAEFGSGGEDNGGVADTGGKGSGGTAAAGTGGRVGGQVGTGGAGPGGSSDTRDAAIGRGGSAGRDAAAGGSSGNGGRGGGPGADAGRGGQGGTRAIDAGPVACDDTQSAGRLAVYYYSDSAVSGSSIQMYFDLVNFTAFTSRLSQVTIRYWFTDELASSANILEQYYVPLPTTMRFVTLNPPRSGANTVLEMSFRDAPDAGASWVETRGFNFAFHKKDYAGTYDQSNDYSYDPKLTKSFGPNPKITAYVNGVLAWGCEPPVEVAVDAGAVADAPMSGVDGGGGGS
jgi:hypothetical protein